VTDLVAHLRGLGIERGDTILVHTSYRAVRPIHGGPDSVIDALIDAVGPDGTVVMPSWSDEDDEVFDPASYEVDDHLGVVADEFWQRPDAVRGEHAFAVAAIGPRAREIAGAPFGVPPHGPESGIGRVYDANGKVVLLGVDHTANTTIHLAETVAGVPYSQRYRILIPSDDGPAAFDYDEPDSCCGGFVQVGDWLRTRGLTREGTFGNGHAMVASSRDIVATVVEELARDACRFLCEAGACEECDEARAAIPG
jgi:aminoglycoside N3'-acetyltransferase